MAAASYNPCNPGDGWWKPLVFAIILAILLLLMAGCTTTKLVTVPEYHTEYVVRSDTIAKVDSVLLHDSVYVYHSGDTVIVNKVRYRDRLKNVYKTRTDTIIKADSIPYKVEVEKPLTAKEQRYIKVGKAVLYGAGWLAFAVLLAVIGAVIYWRKK